MASPSSPTSPVATSPGPAAAEPTRSLLGKFWRQLREQGLQGAVQQLNLWIQRRWYEKMLGISTADSIDASQLGHADCNLGYQPIDYHSFAMAMEALDVDPARDVFVDIGCGMGRAVILAACAPFRRVMGVELSGELCQAARENLQTAYRKIECRDVEIIEADAATWLVPDEVTVIFMYNPFQGPVLSAVLQQIRDSAQRAPRDLRIVYSLPKSTRDVLADQPWLDVEHSLTTLNHDWERLTIYRVNESVGRYA